MCIFTGIERDDKQENTENDEERCNTYQYEPVSHICLFLDYFENSWGYEKESNLLNFLPHFMQLVIIACSFH